jgi:hypothetical protein
MGTQPMRRWMVWRALVLMPPLLAAPAWAAPSAALWAGAWFGTGQPDDKSEMYIDYFLPDGSFRNHHRWCHKGQAEDLSETGHWSLQGDALTVRIDTLNGQPAPRVDDYRALAVDAKIQRYIFLPTNFAYQARRVGTKFEMPPCDLTS